MKWIKASERLPGWYTPVKWRRDGYETAAKETIEQVYYRRPLSICEHEWLDESTPAEDWVKVEDGLPDSRTEVNVYFKNSVGWHVTSAIFDKEIGFFSQDDPQTQGIFPAYSVTHWRNLPSPPKK